MKTNAEVVKVVHKGTFKENSRAIYNYLKVPEIEIDDKEVTSHDNYVFEENFVDKVSEDRAEKSEGIKLLFVGTFLENYEDILESINKFVNNGREDADVVKEKLFNGNEIKEKDSKCEGSRYELEPVDGRKTHEDKVDVHHKHFARNSSPRHYNACCLSNLDKPHDAEPNAEHDDEVQLCGLRSGVLMSKMLLHLVPIILEKFLAMIYSIIMCLKEDVVEHKIASADNFTVTGPCFRQAEDFFQV